MYYLYTLFKFAISFCNIQITFFTWDIEKLKEKLTQLFSFLYKLHPTNRELLFSEWWVPPFLFFFFFSRLNETTRNEYSTWPGQWTNGLWRLWQKLDCSNSRRFSRGDDFLLPLDPLSRTPTLFYSLLPPSTPSSSLILEIIVEARKGRIHILDPTETDPGGARSVPWLKL